MRWIGGSKTALAVAVLHLVVFTVSCRTEYKPYGREPEPSSPLRGKENSPSTESEDVPERPLDWFISCDGGHTGSYGSFYGEPYYARGTAGSYVSAITVTSHSRLESILVSYTDGTHIFVGRTGGNVTGNAFYDFEDEEFLKSIAFYAETGGNICGFAIETNNQFGVFGSAGSGCVQYSVNFTDISGAALTGIRGWSLTWINSIGFYYDLKGCESEALDCHNTQALQKDVAI